MYLKFGNWIFHYRNFLFPVFYFLLFLPSPKLILNEHHIVINASLFFIITGITIRIITIGFEYIVRGGHKRTIFADGLVTGGAYRICRHPMYLGNLMILLGFGIFANSFIFVFIIFPVFIFIYWAIIKAEEAYLSDKFGEKFEHYKQNSNTIIPSFNQIVPAFKNQTFNWRRVIYKEYNSTFLHVSGLLVLSLYQMKIDFKLFSILFFICTIVYLTIKILKYREL